LKTLAFDTSTKFLTIALFEGDTLKAEYHKDEGIRHSEILVPVIKDMLEGLGWKITGIGLICAGIGPGSFTGLRIGVATVKALAAVTGCRVIGVPTMDAVILNYRGKEEKAAPLLDAHKGKVYSCIYGLGGGEPERTTEYMLITADDLLARLKEKVVFFGGAVSIYKDQLDKHPLAGYDEMIDWYPRASEIGRLGIARSASGTDDPEALDPLYLHPKECNITGKR